MHYGHFPWTPKHVDPVLVNSMVDGVRLPAGALSPFFVFWLRLLLVHLCLIVQGQEYTYMRDVPDVYDTPIRSITKLAYNLSGAWGKSTPNQCM
jgi:hypothetical protein